jgi:uncharacterized membrane protein
MFTGVSGIVAYGLITDLLITVLIFVWAEAYQRKQLAKHGKRRSAWLLAVFAAVLAPFVMLQIGVAGCLVILQVGVFNGQNAFGIDNLITWLPFAFWGLLAAGIGWGLLSMQRAGR